MGDTRVLLTLHRVVLCLFQMVALSSEQFTVNGLQSPVLAQLGGNLELSCELSPPQQAKHMEIRWFRNRYTEPIYLYRNGKDLLGRIISKYVERTELLKDDIGIGKVTLRIFNVIVDDDGSYRCFFKDDNFYEEHITEVKVTATSSDIHILMHPPNIEGVMLECHSGGWFPKPHMEWRDSKGELIQATSKSHLQNEKKTFTMKMTLLITFNSNWNVTCYLQNPVTHQEESVNIVLSGELFSWIIVWIMILCILSVVMITFQVTNLLRLKHGNKISSWKKSAILIMMSCSANIGVILILNLRQRVPDSDQHFELDTLWLEDITMVLLALIVYSNKLMLLIYFRLYGYSDGNKNCKYLMLRFSHAMFFTISYGTTAFLQLLNKDPLFFMYRSCMLDITMCLGTVILIFNIKKGIKLLSCITNMANRSIPDCWDMRLSHSARSNSAD